MAGIEAAGFTAPRPIQTQTIGSALNPNRYIVLNSGFTYREYDYLNNARQTPKLPDWAVVDLNEPPGTRWPGKIADAGFFDEHWRFKANDSESQ